MRRLVLIHCSISDASPISHLAHLEKFELTMSDMTALDLAPLSACKRLKWLRLEKVILKDISFLNGLSEIRDFFLYEFESLPRKDLKPLSNLPKLVSLGLLANLDDKNIAQLANLTGLNYLRLLTLPNSPKGCV